MPPPPTFLNQSRTTTPAFTSGYRLRGEYYYDERILIDQTVEGTIFHSLRLVIDNQSVQSTKVFLDKILIGSFQEHFVPRLKGGVFVTHKFGSVGLFQNFKIKGCNKFNALGNCIDGKKLFDQDNLSKSYNIHANDIKFKKKSKIVEFSDRSRILCQNDNW